MTITTRLTGGDIFLVLSAWHNNGQPGEAFVNGKRLVELRIDGSESIRFRGFFELDFIPIAPDDNLEIFYPRVSHPPAVPDADQEDSANTPLVAALRTLWRALDKIDSAATDHLAGLPGTKHVVEYIKRIAREATLSIPFPGEPIENPESTDEDAIPF